MENAASDTYDEVLSSADVSALEQELRERADEGFLGDGKRNRVSMPTLANMPTERLVQAFRDRERVIYGTDDRQELFRVTEAAVKRNADSVVSLWQETSVRNNGNGTSTLLTRPFREQRNLCSGERFADQPVGAFCSGFLVAPDMIATAGHCVDESDFNRTLYIFGYRMASDTSAVTRLPNTEIYRGRQLVGRVLTSGGADWALVRLDRPVTNHTVVRLRRSGTITHGQAVYVIGHPSGLPIKYAPGAQVRSNIHNAFFTANLDTYGGNSGSPVFNSNTHEVEGILVRGETDFVPNGTCFVSKVCPTTGCGGEDVTRVTQFSGLVPI